MDALGEPEVTQTVHVPLLKQLLCCVDAIVKTAGPLCSQHSEAIFIILLRLQASSGDQQGLVEEVSLCSVYRYVVVFSVCVCACVREASHGRSRELLSMIARNVYIHCRETKSIIN